MDEFDRMVENFKNPAPVKIMVDGVMKMVQKPELEALSFTKFESKLN